MATRCLLLALVLASLAICQAASTVQVQAASLSHSDLVFRLADGSAPVSSEWISAARVSFVDRQFNSTGWYGLSLTIDPPSSRTVNDSVSMRAAGFGEGLTTGALICDSVRNFQSQTPTPALQAKLDSWFDTWWQWMRAQGSADLYWTHVQLVLDQLDGLRTGYNQYLSQHSTSVCQPMSPSRMLQLSADVMDVIAALTPPSERTDWLNLSPEEAAIQSAQATHCSAFVRLPADNNMIIGHSTWNVYSGMLRIAKTNDFSLQGASGRIMRFSSAPGYIFSGDDWYTLPEVNMVIVETTNNIFNTDLYNLLTPTGTVISFVRALVANRISKSPQEWVNVFARYNSGTNNNQWIAAQGFHSEDVASVFISEQAPGYIESADVSALLAKQGYFPGYNIPYLPTIYNMTGYPAMVAKFGSLYDYEKCPRAQIFARNASTSTSFDAVQALMRYNDFQNDPLSLSSPSNAVASRYDLLPLASGGMLMGAVDAKVLNGITLAQAGNYGVVCGPTTDQQAPFAWSTSPVSGDWPHFGQPDQFNFDWIYADDVL
jgi:hypothetical protein